MARYFHENDRDIDAVLNGIAELDEKKLRIDASRVSQMRELALAICGKESPERALEIISHIKPSFMSVEGIDERIALCREYVSLCRDSLPAIVPSLDTDEPPKKTVGVLENNYINLALERFCSKTALERIIYSSFDEICESISTGACEYGVLPTESSDNGKLLRFYNLIDRHDLKINAVCDIGYSDDSATTRYALVSKSIKYPCSEFGEPNYLEFTVHLGNAQEISSIIYAGALCNLKLHRIDSLPLPYKDKEFSFCPVFKVKSSDIDTFLLYMSLDFPQYVPIGIFSQL